MSKSKRSSGKTILTMVLFAAVIISGFFMMINRDKKKSEIPSEGKTELDKLLDTDLVDYYPDTPREVLKLYSRITKCFYETSFTDETLEALVDQLRMLYDNEFLINNPREEYITKLKDEIKKYSEEKRKVFSYEVERSKLVEYNTINNEEYATINVNFTMLEKNQSNNVYEKFILRKDSEDKWKILGWNLIPQNQIDGD